MGKINYIGITGKAGSGKDTVAEMLSSKLNKLSIISSLAWPIKTMLKAGFRFDMDKLSREGKEAIIPGLGVSPRRLAQTLGTEWGRNVLGNDCWINSAQMRIDDVCQDIEVSNAIIPDIRFDNEAEWITDHHGGIMIEVSRGGSECEAMVDNQGHASESGVDVNCISWRVDNSGSLDRLSEEVGYLAAFIDRINT